MAIDREMMQKAINRFLIPQIRALGFKGSLPHFRRRINGEHQMLMILFNKYGGSFYVEAGRISDHQVRELQQDWSNFGKSLSESALTVGHCHWRDRARLGPDGFFPGQDHWFVFGPNNTESSAHPMQPESVFENIALQAAVGVRDHLCSFLAGAP
ncbi:MAG: DUF4304 domain-containing protein [Holophagaceae bacterium]|nr:DUF4304 domain-containing protein [Holophagaceae bacterium]